MQLPLEIVARDIDLSPAYRQDIDKRARKLDRFYRRIMRCRVTVEGPGRHHLQGFCTIRLDITVPGNEIVINHQSGENLLEAIKESFDAAERRIEDHIRLSRRQVKVHEGPARARVSKLFPEEGYGFLLTPGGREIYFHRNSLVGIGFDRLKPGTVVRFSEEIGEKGAQASTVSALGRRPATRRRAEPGLAESLPDGPLQEEPTAPGPVGPASRPDPGGETPARVNEAPFARILVPLDGSLTSEAILPYLRRYFAGSELIILRSPESLERSSRAHPRAIAEEVTRYVFLTLERLHRDGWVAHARAASGSPAEAILKAARRTKSSLIAMTTHGRTGSMGQLMGSVAESVVRTSSVPVFVVRPFWLQDSGLAPPQPAQSPKTILVPLSGSDASFGILSHVLVLATQWEARVLLLHVSPEGPGEVRPASEDPLGQVQDELRASGIPVERLEAQGDPLARILEVSEARAVDLVALSTHTGAPGSRLDDRSLTAKILRNSRVPVYGIRADVDPVRVDADPAAGKEKRVRRSKKSRPEKSRRNRVIRAKAGRALRRGTREPDLMRSSRHHAARAAKSARKGRRVPARMRSKRTRRRRG